MIFDFFDGLNWLAVVVATLAWFAFSAIWYSLPPISKAWQRAARIPPEQGPPLPALLVATLVIYFVNTVVIAMIVAATGAQDFADGLALGIALGIGFGLAGALVGQLYEQKGGSYWLINGINLIVSWSGVALILALWD